MRPLHDLEPLRHLLQGSCPPRCTRSNRGATTRFLESQRVGHQTGERL